MRRPRAGLWLRMRLSTLLLLTIIVAMGVALMVQQQRERRLRAELRWARDTNDETIREALEQPVTWPNRPNRPRTLLDVLRFVRASSTQKPHGALWSGGIPIYVEPTGLAEARATLQSPITTGAVAQTTSKAILEDSLEQIGLDYVIDDGMLTITSKKMAERMRHGALAR